MNKPGPGDPKEEKSRQGQGQGLDEQLEQARQPKSNGQQDGLPESNGWLESMARLKKLAG